MFSRLELKMIWRELKRFGLAQEAGVVGTTTTTTMDGTAGTIVLTDPLTITVRGSIIMGTALRIRDTITGGMDYFQNLEETGY